MLSPKRKMAIIFVGLAVMAAIVLISNRNQKPPTLEQMKRIAHELNVENEKKRLAALSSDPSFKFAPGTQARLIYRAMDNLPVFASQASLWKQQEAVKRNDETALATMILDGEIKTVPAGTHVTVMGFGRPGARSVAIPGYGDVWVMSKMIQPR